MNTNDNEIIGDELGVTLLRSLGIDEPANKIEITIESDQWVNVSIHYPHHKNMADLCDTLINRVENYKLVRI